MVDLLCLLIITNEGMTEFGMDYDMDVWKKIHVEKIKEYDIEHEYFK